MRKPYPSKRLIKKLTKEVKVGIAYLSWDRAADDSKQVYWQKLNGVMSQITEEEYYKICEVNNGAKSLDRYKLLKTTD
jgi:hypothetical protein